MSELMHIKTGNESNDIKPVKAYKKNVDPKFWAYQRWQKSEIIQKANRYHIPFDTKLISWEELKNKVEEYEKIVDEANICGFFWDETEYDPQALLARIEHHHKAELEYLEEINSYYLSTRL